MRGTVELAKSIAKLTLIGVIAWMVITGAISGLLATMFMDLKIALMSIENVAFSLASKLVLVLVILGILDFAYQRFEFEKQLKMSKQELKEEYKQMEGDPLVRSKIREKGCITPMYRLMVCTWLRWKVRDGEMPVLWTAICGSKKSGFPEIVCIRPSHTTPATKSIHLKGRAVCM